MNRNWEHRPTSFNRANTVSSHAIVASFPLAHGHVVQYHWGCHLLRVQGIANGVLSHLQIVSDGISVSVSLAPNELQPFMDLGSFELWDEVSDDAIEFPEGENIAFDFASIEHKIAFTISLVRGIPDIPPERLL